MKINTNHYTDLFRHFNTTANGDWFDLIRYVEEIIDDDNGLFIRISDTTITWYTYGTKIDPELTFEENKGNIFSLRLIYLFDGNTEFQHSFNSLLHRSPEDLEKRYKLMKREEKLKRINKIN